MQSILDLCKDSEPREFSSGEVLITEGNKSGVIYVLLEGKVEITKGKHLINTVTEPGATFGEMSVLLDIPHMATVKTVGPSQLYVLESSDSLLSSEDLTGLIAKILAKRLNNITNYVLELKERSTDSEEKLGMVCEVLEKYIYQSN